MKNLHNITCAKWSAAPGRRADVACTCADALGGLTVGTRVVQKGGGIRGVVVTRNLVDKTITLDNPFYTGPYLADYFERDNSPATGTTNARGERIDISARPNPSFGPWGGLDGPLMPAPQPLPHTTVKYDHPNSTITVDHVPDWMTAHDLIVKRGRRKYALALNQTEPRYRSWRRKYPRLMRVAALIIALTITALWVVVCYKLRAFR